MSWKEYYSTPLYRKMWLINRMKQEIEKSEQNEDDIPTKAPHDNHPQMRAITNKVKKVVNPKTWRKT